MLLGKSNFFKADEVSSGDMLEILDAGVKVPSDKFTYSDGNPVINYQFKVKILKSGEEKTMNINKTSRDSLEMAYGNETEKWIGKTASIIKELNRERSTPEKKSYKIFLEPATDLNTEKAPF